MESYPQNNSEASSSTTSPPDPERGYQFIVNGGYVGCGIPLSVARRMGSFLEYVPSRIYKWINPLVEGSFFRDPGIPGRTGINANLAHDFNAFVTRRGNEVINFNCLSCHSQRIGNQIIVGLGNSVRDYTYDLRILLTKTRALYWTQEEKEEGFLFERTLSAIAPYIVVKTVGVNPAINLSYALMAHRDPLTLAWSDDWVISPPDTHVPPVHVPPWWRMRKRKTMFYNAEFTGTHRRIMMSTSLLGNDSVEDVKLLDNSFSDVEAYIKSLPPPPYPRAIDSRRASQGQEIFKKNCTSCHGTYGPDGNYPERIIPIEVIQTDPALMNQETSEDHNRFVEYGNRSYYGELTQFHANRGYVAPALDGIWATAPYFHNGSVPTLEGVLDSTKRPKYWKRSVDPNDYNIEEMRWEYQEISKWNPFAFLPFERRYVYDTTQPGYSNQGHTFGDHLSHDERIAVIEYLKTL